MPAVLMYASSVSLLSGLSEEIVFRGALPAAIFGLSHSIPLTLAVQALLFGHAHISPQASRGENQVMCGLHTIHGLWYGLAYLMLGGDVLPCIVAHALHDIHVFMKTWDEVNDQMDYTEGAVLEKLSPADEEAIRLIKEEAGPSLTAETLAYARRFFFAFDYEHQGSLSEADVQRAVSFAFLQDQVQPSQERVHKLFRKILGRRDSPGPADRLQIAEFLRLLFLLKANPRLAPKPSL